MSKRFMVVEHDPKQSKILQIHGLLGTYHWQQLDDAHVIVVATYSSATHTALHNHDKVSVIPVIGSHKKLCKCLKDRHYNALKNHLNLDDEHVSEDAIDLLGAKFGPLFSP
jgi:hypothetical protein